MVTLFSDLDNTLIFSHRKQYSNEKILVELLNGQEQSYITARLVQVLEDIKELSLVPVTTRSVEQYVRINTLSDFTYNRHALVCNGGVLLINGNIDQEWLNESKRLSDFQSLEVQKILEKVKADGKAQRINILQDFMFYFTCDETEDYYSKLKEEFNSDGVYIGKDARKIYVIASAINKGSCVQRYVQRFGNGKFMTAGDSDFDVSMLNLDAPAIASSELRGKLDNTKVMYSREQYLFQDIDELIKKVIEDL